jgi:hypothetical protein
MTAASRSRAPTASRRLGLIPASATQDEAAAIVAAIERFIRATARGTGGPPSGSGEPVDRWRRAALLEGVELDPFGDAAHPWINT